MTFTIQAAPTFSSDVLIPVPGKASVPVAFTFKHRTKKELDAFIDALKDRKDSEIVLDMVSAWAIEEEFTPENVGTLLNNYGGVARSIFETYTHELQKHR
jgi:hypothetical protein